MVQQKCKQRNGIEILAIIVSKLGKPKAKEMKMSLKLKILK